MKSSLSKNIVYSTIYQILLILIPLITTPYISRVLGADSVGFFSYNNSIAQYFLLFAVLGLANYGNREIARNKDNKENLNKCFSKIYYSQLIVAAFVFAIYLLYASFLSEYKTAAFCEAVLVGSALFDLSWLLNGLEEFRYITIRGIIIKLLSVFFIFIFIKSPDDIYLYILINGGSVFLTNVLCVPKIIKKQIRLVTCTKKEIFSNYKPLLILFIPILAISVYKYLNNIFLKHFSSFEEAGFFASAYKLVVVPVAIVTALGNVMLPKLSIEYKSNNQKSIDKFLKNGLFFAVWVSTALGLGISAVSKDFVPLYYGEGFEKCVVLIPILMISTIFLGIANVIRTQILIPNNEDKKYIVSIVAGALIDIVLGIILIISFASIGAAIISVITEFVVCAVQIFLCRKEKNLIKYILLSTPFIACGLVMFVVVYFLNFNFGTIVNLLLKIVIGASIFLFLSGLYYFILKKQEMKNGFLEKDSK